MNKYYAKNFTLTTDFATMKNDDSGTLQITIPGSLTIPAGGPNIQPYTISTSTIVGLPGTNMQVTINNSSIPATLVATIIQIDYDNGTVSGVGGFIYTITMGVYRSAPNTVTVTAFINNPYSDPLLTGLGGVTFFVTANTFVPPFSS